MYLPAAFCYAFEAKRFPANVDHRTGDGFRLNLTTDKVETKYPYGVSLLQAPFWGAAQLLSADKSGFSVASHKAIDVAAATYLVWGLWLLFITLKRQFSSLVSFLTLVALTLGTNLWYYAIIETGMSHVYSFFAFSVLLWQLGRVRIPAWGRSAETLRELTAIAFTIGIISVLRPLNLVLALPLLLWPAHAQGNGFQQLRGLIHWRPIGILIVAVGLCWVPQLAYYHYLHGKLWVYSYGQENFPYLLSPRLAEVWFAPNNGSFLYNPVLLLALPGGWWLGRRSGWWGGMSLFVWAAASYLYAAWWAYQLGCGYAGRGFVDLYPVLAWPLAAFIEHVWHGRRRWGFGLLGVVLFAYNLRFSLCFDRCFYGQHDWDWAAYYALLTCQ